MANTNNYNVREYGTLQYWDERYIKQKDVTFDWVEQYAEIKKVLNENCINALYDKHCSVENRNRIEKEADEELKQILERGAAEENGGGAAAEEQKATAGE